MSNVGNTSDNGEPRSRAKELKRHAEVCEVTSPIEIDELISIVLENDGEEATLAAEALDKIGHRYPSVFERSVGEFLHLVDSPVEESRFVGVRSLAQLAVRNPEAVEPAIDPVEQLLDSSSPRIQAASLAFFAEILSAHPEYASQLEDTISESLTHTTAIVRSAATLTTGRAFKCDPPPDSELIEQLYPRLDDDDERVVKRAYWALLNISQESPELIPNPTKTKRHLRGASEEALGLMEGAIKEALANLESD